MALIQIYYKNGNYEEISPTLMSFGDGYLLQSEYIQNDDIEEKGIVWERSFFPCNGDDAEDSDAALIVRKVQIVSPESLQDIECVVLNGNVALYGNLKEAITKPDKYKSL